MGSYPVYIRDVDIAGGEEGTGAVKVSRGALLVVLLTIIDNEKEILLVHVKLFTELDDARDEGVPPAGRARMVG